MSAEFPDRVAAIVDLMSHLFMLSVMLFVLAIPFRSQLDTSQEKRLSLKVWFYADGAVVPINLHEIAGKGNSLELEIRFDDGLELRRPQEALRYLRLNSVGGRVEIVGYFRAFQPKKIVALLTNVGAVGLLGKKIDVFTVVNERCNGTAAINIGVDPIYQFDVGSCMPG